MSEFLSPGLSPFLIAAGLVLALLLLEILLMLTGLSTHGGGDVAGLHAGADLGHDLQGMTAAAMAAELHIPVDLAAEIAADLDTGSEISPTVADPSGAGGGLLDIIGIRKLPLTVWLALCLACFGAVGLALQSGLQALFGSMLPPLPAIALAIVPALALTRGLAGRIARLIPRDETAAISEHSLGRRRGVVTVGTAKRGSPAQVRITDQYGNVHYAMIEPFADADEISQGAEVVVLRLRGGQLRLVQVGQIAGTRPFSG